MDIKEIKNLLKNSGVVIIMEDGQPTLVITQYDNYSRLLNNEEEKKIRINHIGRMEQVTADPTVYVNPALNRVSVRPSLDTEILEKLNEEISVLKTQIESEEKNTSVVDDLPDF